MSRQLSVPLRSALVAYREALQEALPGKVRRLTLFGSMARGQAHEDSDVDILVLLDSPTFDDRRRAMDWATRVGLAHDFIFAPVVLSTREWQELIDRERRFPREVAADGVDL